MPARPLRAATRRAKRASGGASAPLVRVEQRSLYEYASPSWNEVHRTPDYEQGLGVARSLSKGPFGRGLEDVVVRVTAGARKRPVHFYMGEPIDGSRTSLEHITAQFQEGQRRKPWHVEEVDLVRPGEDWRFKEGADTKDLASSRAHAMSRGLFSFAFRAVRGRDGVPVAHFLDGKSVRASTIAGAR